MPEYTAAAERPPTTLFAEFLRQQRRGLLHAELTDALADVVAGVVKHGKTGKLTVTFTIKSKSDDAIEIADSYVAKVPTPPASASLFFADEDGHLSRQRINQPELPLRGIEGAKGATSTDDAEATAT